MGENGRNQACARTGLTRRVFMKTMGVGSMALCLQEQLAITANAGTRGTEIPAGKIVPVLLNINQQEHRVHVQARWTLLFVLREKLRLTGTKQGCGRGECGACTVLIDGVPRYACMTLALEAQGRSIETVEGLLHGEDLGPVQEAFVQEDAFQCGYCTPGQVVAAEGLLRASPHPDAQEVRTGMSGNLCRCGAYTHIARAVERAAGNRSQR